MGDVQCEPRSAGWSINRVNNWQRKFIFKPTKCALTDQILWWCYAMYGNRTIHGPAGEPPVIMEYVINTDDFYLWQLGKIYA